MTKEAGQYSDQLYISNYLINPGLSTHHGNMAISNIWHAGDISSLINDNGGIINILLSLPQPLTSNLSFNT